ncbi:hypothetical protein J433_05610 [Corynebacterium glutamicum MT]|uniref:Aspartate/homoserine dehydrogenase NAD-binding domain-containing protein n=2 Tax=Corynebacterium glutamicum TaxID=1718 RepID=A0AB36IHY1_CORGT|nr:hypothetical protein [Corynebacterium glutamicum]EOA65090.1 hypothetical protein J433_05610 [Corynebacterium glutamicum MT]NII87741.1 putative dinucleotide-utilizing enzyme [Corynebacterium glutamicum]OKX78721.1 hypothetical protein AUP70_08065 [Corynebacterium glutamicum]OKX83094.1 hypothetical protein AUP69_04810 [Corynebacterium glutamicum]TWS48662.1 hypothetical protein AKJ22_04925 [Corynebacterium glutamicum]
MATSAPKVLLLGLGAIGRQLVTLFDEGEFEVKAFVSTVSPHIVHGTLGIELYDDQLPKFIADSGSVVEVAHGKDLILTSVGALAEQAVRQALLVGSGKVHVTSGAIGGFDLFLRSGRPVQ